MTSGSLDLLPPIIRAQPRTWVEPSEFFIAWGGVPTLAFKGFSRVLLDLKAQISVALPGLKPENPGARWPKSTLGALRVGCTLTAADALALRRICTTFRPRVIREEPLAVHELSLVVFASRSLERRILTYPIEMAPSDRGPEAEQNQPSEEHELEVRAVMAQFVEEHLGDYLPRLQAAGNGELHYRAHHVEATLVFDLDAGQPACIADFMRAVEGALPGYYTWFEPQSRHMTVRGLG